jgi:hypothetical protein
LLEAIGTVVTAWGVRHAVAKASQGIVQLHPLATVIALAWTFGALFLPRTLPSPFPLTLAPDEYYGAAADSLKYVISWKEPSDTAALGKVDSTFFRFVSSKGVTFFGSTGLTTPNVAVRRTSTGHADSLKLAKPPVGGQRDLSDHELPAVPQGRLQHPRQRSMEVSSQLRTSARSAKHSDHGVLR